MQRTEERWSAQTRALRKHAARHRVAWTLGLGVAAGFVAGLLPARRITRTSRSIVDVLAFVLGSPIGTSLIARAMQRDGNDKHEPARTDE